MRILNQNQQGGDKMANWFKLGNNRFTINKQTLREKRADLWKHLEFNYLEDISRQYIKETATRKLLTATEFLKQYGEEELNKVWGNKSRKGKLTKAEVTIKILFRHNKQTTIIQFKGTLRKDKTIVFTRYKPKAVDKNLLLRAIEILKTAHRITNKHKQLKKRKDLISLLRGITTDEYKIEEKPNDITATYHDAYDYEQIALTRTWNMGTKADNKKAIWKTAKYDLWIEKISDLMESEIDKPSVLSQHNMYPEEFEDLTEEEAEKKIEEIEQESEKDIEYWKQKKAINLKGFGYELEISPTITEIECYVNITHTHIYKGLLLHTTTTDKQHINTILKARDIIFDIYDNIS